MHKGSLALAGIFVVAAMGAASAASIDKSVEVKAPASKVWSMIGPFCAIKDWHPAIGKCTEEGGVRTLVTKDGKATFVEKQTGHDDKDMSYSYHIEKSPLPMSDYNSTIKVVSTGADSSKVEWSATYTPEKGKEQDVDTALTGIYQGGLDNIQKTAQ